jgi:titin
LWSNDPIGPFDSIVVNGTSYLHEGLENGRTYYYEVIAVNAEGESEPSSVVSATPNPITSVPSAPMNLVAQASSSSIELTWDVPVDDGGSAITGYKVSYSLDPAGTFASIIVNGTSYLHDGLENGRTYYYQVSAINAHGEGIKTNMISATPSSGLILPSVPTNLVASIANGDVSLNWTAPSDGADITGYRVYRGYSPSTISLLTSTTNTIFLDTTVTSNRTYYYQVSAVNEYGESNRSNTVIVVMSSFDQTEPSPSFFETIEGQVAIAGMVVAGLGAVAYTLWHFRRTRT